MPNPGNRCFPGFVLIYHSRCCDSYHIETHCLESSLPIWSGIEPNNTDGSRRRSAIGVHIAMCFNMALVLLGKESRSSVLSTARTYHPYRTILKHTIAAIHTLRYPCDRLNRLDNVFQYGAPGRTRTVTLFST